MRNIEKAINNALIVGGIIGIGAGAMDAVSVALNPEVIKAQGIEQELRNDFQVHEVCIVFGPEVPICRDVADKMLAPDEAAR